MSIIYEYLFHTFDSYKYQSCIIFLSALRESDVYYFMGTIWEMMHAMSILGGFMKTTKNELTNMS